MDIFSTTNLWSGILQIVFQTNQSDMVARDPPESSFRPCLSFFHLPSFLKLFVNKFDLYTDTATPVLHWRNIFLAKMLSY